ncbi:MAG: adenosylmethionine--8-amino-7-oxononanoate transaminase [Verrucomicrobiae bacterium]|nr:adenosylmethionine--8-amino-7-oxononanoate transaminase [Verrucomicrobiae bacterium]
MRDWLRAAPPVIVRGEGPFLVDARGKRRLDANASIWTNLHGHRHPRMDRAIRRQLGKIAHCSALGLANEPAALLAEKLVRLAPRGLAKVFYSDDGATALEVALKMAWQARRQGMGREAQAAKRPAAFLALGDAYHGDTIGAASLGGIEAFHAAYRPLLFPTTRVMSPFCYRCPYNRAKPERADARLYRDCRWECLSEAEKALAPGRKSTARSGPFTAAVVEPLIQGAAGMIAHPEGWLRRFAKLCRAAKVPLLLDEVMTGFGRTGTMFACEQEDVSPDFLCLAKGLTGGYLPLAATLTTRRVFNAFLGDYAERKTFFHGHSYTANPLGCAAALANLEIFEREKVLARVRRLGAGLDTQLARFWTSPHVGDLRRVGLIAGIELVRDWRTREPFPWAARVGVRVCEEAKKLGVLTRPVGNVLVVMPPYCVTEAHLARIADALLLGIRRVCG